MKGRYSERLFAELCNKHFLRGFTFHSPSYFDPTEKEAGDVVLWVRQQVIIVEVLAREAAIGTSTKQFIKRIGEKRNQLKNDYSTFNDPYKNINLNNEDNERVALNKEDINRLLLSGIILVDCDDKIDQLNFNTVKHSLDLEYPTSIMTKQDLTDLLEEVDTIPDLMLYLKDRFAFLKIIFHSNAKLFLDLNNRLERNLISFYKMHNNSFPIGEWNQAEALFCHRIYKKEYAQKIASRDQQNDESFVIDEIIDSLRTNNTANDSTLFHSWELASMTRRQRAVVASKIENAISNMEQGKPRRQFAFFNQATECWLVFFFQFGGTSAGFRLQTEQLTRYKLCVELQNRQFKYSVFGYGFRKSSIETGNTFDEIKLWIEDADKYSLTSGEYTEARRVFGKLQSQSIQEFPD